jgi:hypothetical protein
VEMATDVVAGVSCTRIGLSLLRLLGVGDGREEESKSRTMKNPFMGGLDSAMPCQCFLRLALSLKANRRTLPLFDDELIVLVFLTSFQDKAWWNCRSKISFTITAVSSFCELELDYECLWRTRVVFPMPRFLLGDRRQITKSDAAECRSQTAGCADLATSQ